MVHVFKNWKLLFENFCGNTCGWKSVLKYVKCCLKTENCCLKTLTKHPLNFQSKLAPKPYVRHRVHNHMHCTFLVLYIHKSCFSSDFIGCHQEYIRQYFSRLNEHFGFLNNLVKTLYHLNLTSELYAYIYIYIYIKKKKVNGCLKVLVYEIFF